jgi:hypothetical protein
MVLHRVDCGLPRFCGFLTQAARSRRGSLFIGILASLPIQRRDLLVRKMRISGMLARFWVWALVILCSLTSNRLMFSMVLRLRWWNEYLEGAFDGVGDGPCFATPESRVECHSSIYCCLCFKVDVGVPEEGS